MDILLTLVFLIIPLIANILWSGTRIRQLRAEGLRHQPAVKPPVVMRVPVGFKECRVGDGDELRMSLLFNAELLQALTDDQGDQHIVELVRVDVESCPSYIICMIPSDLFGELVVVNKRYP